VPTGMNTGVSITPRLVVSTPARDCPVCVSTSKRNAGADVERSFLTSALSSWDRSRTRLLRFQLEPLLQWGRQGRLRSQDDQCLCSPFLFLLMSFDESQWRSKEIELLTKPILKITLIGKMESRFTTGGKDDKGRWPNADLRQVLHSQS